MIDHEEVKFLPNLEQGDMVQVPDMDRTAHVINRVSESKSFFLESDEGRIRKTRNFLNKLPEKKKNKSQISNKRKESKYKRMTETYKISKAPKANNRIKPTRNRKQKRNKKTSLEELKDTS